MRLTDLSLRVLKSPERGAVIYYDDFLTGFGVRVSNGGTKSFVLTHGVRRERETIGRVGVLSLQEARAEAKRRLAEYTLGKASTRSISWNAAVEQYLRQIEQTRRLRTYQSYKYALQKHFRFGPTNLTDLKPDDFARRIDKLLDRPSEQAHAFGVLRSFLGWAFQRSYLDVNPVQRMKSPHRYRPRTRVLTKEELVNVWKAAEEMRTFGSIVKLLILTGQRTGEISRLTPRMIGTEMITLPAWLAKNGREHVFPIGPTTKAILGAYCDSAGNQDRLLFPARGEPDVPFNGFSKSKAALDNKSGVRDWTLHDLRRTFATGLASRGVSLPVVERLLNHVSGSFSGIVAVYQRYDFAPEMRRAVQDWEMHLQILLGADAEPQL